MKKHTVELTRKQFGKIGWLAQELGLRTETGSNGHRVIGSEEKLEALGAVVHEMFLQTHRGVYRTILSKLTDMMYGWSN